MCTHLLGREGGRGIQEHQESKLLRETHISCDLAFLSSEWQCTTGL